MILSKEQSIGQRVEQIASITIGIDLQQREDLYHPPTVQRYSELMSEGVEFPPVIVFDDGDKLYLADGFQRVHAALKAGFTEINTEVHKGSQRDALLFSTQCQCCPRSTAYQYRQAQSSHGSTDRPRVGDLE